MTVWMISGVLGFISGGAAVWFFRPQMMLVVNDANAVSAKLHAEADKIKAAV
jgi:hypothetical protein